MEGRRLIMTSDEAWAVNVLVREVYHLGTHQGDRRDAPDPGTTRQAAYLLLAGAYKKLGMGIHPSDVVKIERRPH